MKQLIISIVFLLTSIFSFSQNVEECEKIVMQTYEAISNKNADIIMGHLSDDFKIAGYSGEIAKLILPQLISQLTFTPNGIKKVSESQSEMLTLVYEADFGGESMQNSTFIFNNENKLTELELLNMEIKTMQSEANVIKDDKAYFTVPFERFGNLIAVEAKLNGVSRMFLVDNGAPIFVLNNAHVEKDYTVKKTALGEAKGAGGAISNMDIENIESFELQGFSMKSQDLVSMDLSHLEKELGEEIYGLIGYEIYKDYDLLFDYQKSTLTIIKPEFSEEFIKNNFKSSKLDAVPIEMQGHIGVVSGFINGKEYLFGIDCGAETNLIDVSLQNELKNSFSKLKTDTLVGADKNLVEVVSGKIKSLQMGATNFKKTQTISSDISHLNDGYNIQLDGLIGYEILSKQPTLISYKNKKIVFIK